MPPMKYKTLSDLFLLKLKSLYDIESEIIKVLPKVIQKIQADELRQLVDDHLEETKQQKKKLEKIFAMINEKPKKIRVEGIRGVIRDIIWILQEDIKDKLRDTLLIAVLQYVEHYEMAGYGSLRSWAELLERHDAARLLEEILNEEEVTDNLLSQLADEEIDRKALSEG
jgi:ferritin-like metal-binding protein YciE